LALLESPQLPQMCSIHLDDVTAAILCQNVHHTSLLMESIYIWGWLGGHDDGQIPRDKSQDLGLTSHPKDRALW